MRTVLAIVAVGLIGPSVLAHGSDSEGLSTATAMLAGIEAGDAHEHPLASDEGPLRQGWIFILVAAQNDVSPGLRLALVHEGGNIAAEWTLEAARTRQVTMAIPETGEYVVAVASDANETTKYGFYYDVSCNCASKTVPWEVTPGLVVFNVDGRPGERIQAQFPEKGGFRFQVTAAEQIGSAGSWPEDFRALEISTGIDAQEREATVHRLRPVFPDEGRIYFFVETLEFVPGYEMDDLVITPAFASEEASVPVSAAAALAALIGATALGRRRGTGHR